MSTITAELVPERDVTYGRSPLATLRQPTCGC